MAAYDLIIKATSLVDLETALSELHQRFQNLPALEEPADQLEAEGTGASPVAARARRRRDRPVGSAARSPAAGADQASAGHAGEPLAGAPAGGGDDSGGVEPQAAAQAEGASPEDTATAQAQAQAEGAGSEAPAQDEAAEKAADPQAGGEAGEAAADGEGAAADGAGADQTGEADPVPTIEDVKTAVKGLIQEKGIEVAQAVLAQLGIKKPGETPPEKARELLALIAKEMA